MYCIKCGAKLSDAESVCPLCGTRVCHPDIKINEGAALYPKNRMPKREGRSKGPAIFATACFLLPAVISLLCDLQINGGITFSLYVIGALILAYVALILPSWFKDPNPVIFVPASFAAAALYLAYINFETDGDWYLGFALPTLGALALIVCTVVTLTKYLSRGRLFIFGGASIAFGAMMLLVEFLLSVTFPIAFIGWFVYPLATFSLVGGFLIFLGICPGARESMERLFFI